MRRSGNQIIHSVALDFGPYAYYNGMVFICHDAKKYITTVIANNKTIKYWNDEAYTTVRYTEGYTELISKRNARNQKVKWYARIVHGYL